MTAFDELSELRNSLTRIHLSPVRINTVVSIYENARNFRLERRRDIIKRQLTNQFGEEDATLIYHTIDFLLKK